MKKSKFNLSHNASLTASMGNLIPFCTIDCLPNDSHRLSVDSFIRAQPMMAPLMHNVRFLCQWWFVPYRILWDNWTEFITGGIDNTAAPTFPTIKIKPETSSLADYFGIPVNNKELEVSALPFRAYAEIWNTRYRDEDLQNQIAVSYEDGEDKITSTALKRCSWAKDYFTTARPWTQRGVQISVPVGQPVPVSKKFSTTLEYLGSDGIIANDGSIVDFSFVLCIKPEYFQRLHYSGEVSFHFSKATGGGKDIYSDESQSVYAAFSVESDRTYNIVLRFRFSQVEVDSPVTSGNFALSYNAGSNFSSGVVGGTTSYTNNPFVSVSSYEVGASVNIRDLRLSSALQRYQERSLEYGNRYEEFIQREFGIRPRDSRIQRPEYLGGSKSILQISEVLQTSEGETTGVGTMRGHGVGGLRQRPIRFRAPEHGIIIGLFSIRPDSVYTQGLARQWTKFSKLDYYIPELANVGMQEVFQSELYADGTNSKTIFGYSPRYEEYRKLPNRISGEFRKLLNYWNLARSFDAPPVLNADFLTMNPSKRIFAEQTQDSFLVMLRNNIKSYRVVPKRAKNILR